MPEMSGRQRRERDYQIATDAWSDLKSDFLSDYVEEAIDGHLSKFPAAAAKVEEFKQAISDLVFNKVKEEFIEGGGDNPLYLVEGVIEDDVQEEVDKQVDDTISSGATRDYVENYFYDRKNQVLEDDEAVGMEGGAPEVLRDLVTAADRCDQKGMTRQAAVLDGIIKSVKKKV